MRVPAARIFSFGCIDNRQHPRGHGVVHRQDRITLGGVKIFPRIGTTPEERSSPQECNADLVLWGDFEAAASTDSLDKSVDYSRVLTIVTNTAMAQEYSLVETLAYAIVRNVLRAFPLDRVRVKLRKRPASLIDQLDFVEIEIEES
jgi:7,8-dihydroneopterin aldolase/epimerase/oxygenase